MRKDGRFEAKGIDPQTGKRKSFYSTVSQEHARKLANNSYGIHTDNTLYGFYVDGYIPSVQGRSYNWRAQIAWAMDNYILPRFGAMDMSTITRRDLQLYFNSLSQSGLKASSIQKIKIVLSGVLNLAEADELIARNPARLVRLPAANKPDKQALSALELFQLIECSPDLIRPFVILCSFGLRAGEALGVTRTALTGGMVSVRQQVLQPKGGCIVTQTLKTPQSNRDVPIPEEARAMLECNQRSAVWVCSDTEGGYLLPNNASRELDAVIEAHGLKRVTPHELRHTFISILELELEVPSPIVAKLAGKQHKGVTEGYSHATSLQMARATQRYWSLIQSAGAEAKRFAAG